MRLIGTAALAFVLAVASSVAGISSAPTPARAADGHSGSDAGRQNDGKTIFRYDTFGDEQLWTDVLRMHEVIPSIDPVTALGVGLKVDVEALPSTLVAALRAGTVDLTDPDVTVELLRLDAIVGVRGTVEDSGRLAAVGVTCALCHSSVDDSLAPGIGKRLDGWANIDLNVGAIVALSPVLDAATKGEFQAWGPGKYDPRHHAFDGSAIIPLNTPSVPIVIPPIYGLKGVGFETFTGDGPISYWNSYVGVGQMGGQGTFADPRIGLSITQTPDLVTPKLAALLKYQLKLKAPKAPAGSYDRDAADRGKDLFRNEARCSSCHQGPTFTDVSSGTDRRVPVLHEAAEVGMNPDYALRSATRRYRTTPLRGLQQHPPYFHDGSAADLPAVIAHYDRLFSLGLTSDQQADLVEYLKSL